MIRLRVMEMLRMSLSDSTANPEDRLFREGFMTLFNIVIIPDILHRGRYRCSASVAYEIMRRKVMK